MKAIKAKAMESVVRRPPTPEEMHKELMRKLTKITYLLMILAKHTE